MSSPLSPITALGLATAATAHGVAHTVTRSVTGFGEFLRQAIAGSGASTATSALEKKGELSLQDQLAQGLEQLRQAIAQGLDGQGIASDSLLAIEVDDFSQLRVGGEHPQAWQVEQFLNNSPEIGALVRRIGELRTASEAVGQNPTSNDLVPSVGIAGDRGGFRIYVSGPERRLTLA